MKSGTRILQGPQELPAEDQELKFTATLPELRPAGIPTLRSESQL
jgi:hypothetical protein